MIKFKQRVLTRRRLIVVGIFLTCVIIYSIGLLPVPDLYIHFIQLESIDCYYDHDRDMLPSAGDVGFYPSPRSIFFHETSCKGGLDTRQACAVEAAARAHPHWEIHVLFAAPVHSFEGPMKTVQQFNNVHFTRFHISDYVKSTPLENFVHSGGLNQSRWRISHSSDVLRYTTLFKWGGIYLDLDAIVVKPLSALKPNWAARESEKNVAAGALAFSRDDLGRIVAEKAIREIANDFRGDIWGYNGPGVITRVLKQMCSTRFVVKMSAASCKGFEVYGPKLFYPVTWQEADYYFQPGVLNYPAAYVFHVWNRVTHDTPVKNNSRYANLARQYCPTVYGSHPEDFGVIAHF